MATVTVRIVPQLEGRSAAQPRAQPAALLVQTSVLQPVVEVRRREADAVGALPLLRTHVVFLDVARNVAPRALVDAVGIRARDQYLNDCRARVRARACAR
jgi:hypothetical protein